MPPFLPATGRRDAREGPRLKARRRQTPLYASRLRGDPYTGSGLSGPEGRRGWGISAQNVSLKLNGTV